MKRAVFDFSEAVKLRVAEIFATLKAVILGDHFVYAKKPDGWYHGKDYVNKDAIFPYPLKVSELCKFITDALSKAKIDLEAFVGPTVGGSILCQWLAAHMTEVLDKPVMAVFADEEEVLEEVTITLIDRIPEGTKEELKSRGIEFDISCSGKGILTFNDVRGKVVIVKHKDESENIIYHRKIETRRVIKRGYPELIKGKKVVICEDVVNSGATVIKTILAAQQAGAYVVGVVSLSDRSLGKVTAESLGVDFYLTLMRVDMVMHKEADCPDCQEKGFESVRQDLGKGKEFLQRKGLC